MRISTFKLSNYKSFLDSGELKFTSGINVIIGQNTAGKTALLEALGLNFPAKPHRSLLSAPQRTTPLNPVSAGQVVLAVSGEEIREILLAHGQFNLPIPHGRESDSQQNFQGLLEELLRMDEVCFQLSTENGGWKILRFPAHGLYECKIFDKNRANFASFQVTQDRSRFLFSNVINGELTAEIGITVAEGLRQRIYSFRAERLNIGSCGVGFNEILQPDARNLAEVLYVLQGSNPSRFKRYNELIRRIFPFIYWISVRPQLGSTGTVEILVWMEDPSTEREDLAIPLSESGTGVGQVLAMLYVAINSALSRVILIDEPNSFLHPGAARKLIDILSKKFPQHQYIISTHSPEIIRAANPRTLKLIRWEKPKSVVDQLDTDEITQVRRCLMEVGVKLSDIFAADQVLWVEGPTEEECFPRIFSDLLKSPTLGFSIVGVRNTGDFEGKHGLAIIDIYSKLSKGNALLPNALAFIFDREDRTEKEIEELSRRLEERVHFLPRRTYENYLIDPDALAAVMNSLTTFQNNPITPAKVADWLTKNGGNKKYINTPAEDVDLQDKCWLENVHGAKLLADMLQELSEQKEVYRKTSHSVQLTEWLISNKPDQLAEVGKFLQTIVARKDV